MGHVERYVGQVPADHAYVIFMRDAETKEHKGAISIFSIGRCAHWRPMFWAVKCARDAATRCSSTDYLDDLVAGRVEK